MREPVPATRSFSVFQTLGEAWELTKGAKWALWAPMLVMIGIALASSLISSTIIAFLYSKQTAENTGGHIGTMGIVLIVAASIIIAYLCLGLISGVIKVSIERARGNLVSGGSGFHSYSRVLPVFFAILLTITIAELPEILAFLAGYFGVIKTVSKEVGLTVIIIQFIYGLIIGSLLYLTVLFAVDRTNNPFSAMASSFCATKHHWYRIIGIILMLYVFMALVYLPMFLGIYFQNTILHWAGTIFMLVAFVWLMPFFFLVPGVIYHKLAD